MPARVAMLLSPLLAAMLVAGPVPAVHAGDGGGVGVVTWLVGFITSRTWPSPPYRDQVSGFKADVPGYNAAAACSFAAVLLPNNTVDFVYGGAAWAEAAVVPPRVAQQTILECRISNDRGNVANFVWTNGGPVTVHTASVTGWPFSSTVTLCARSHVFFGPTDPFDVDTGYQCDNLLAGG